MINETNCTCPVCPECFNISKCPTGVKIAYSNYNVNVIFLFLLGLVVAFIFWKIDSPWWAALVAGILTLIICVIGAWFGWISGTLLLIFEIFIFLYACYKGKQELGL